jgi:peptide/nickel transport system substrate-binding protein
VLGPAGAQPDVGARYGGTLVLGDAFGDAAPLDPALSPGGATTTIIFRTIAEKLYDLDAKSELVPLLATALPAISADRLTYTIPVRKGVLFNDGTSFNAQSVVTTLQHDMTFPGSLLAGQLSSIDTITTSGPYTVVIHLSSRDSGLPIKLAGGAGIVLSPTQLTRLGSSFLTDPVGVGPFMFDNRVAGSSVTVIKSPYYYDKYAVHLDKIVFVPATDPAAAVVALKAGDLQIVYPLDSAQLPAVQQDPAVTTIVTRTVGSVTVGFNIGNENGVGNTPYANVGTPFASSAKLREAFEEALDRDTIVKVVFGGAAEPGCTAIPPAAVQWYDPTIPCTPYDPKDARRLVVSSGYPTPTVHLLTPNSIGLPLLAQVIQSEEAAVGINVVIDTLSNTANTATLQIGDWQASLGIGVGVPDPDNILGGLATSSPQNYGGYSNPRLDYVLASGADRPRIVICHRFRYLGVSVHLSGVRYLPDAQAQIAFAQYR